MERTFLVTSTRHSEKKAFKNVLPRLALRHPQNVLPSLLTLSGVHYCNSSLNVPVHEVTWTHLGVALRSLKHSITLRSATNIVPLLATTLILCFVEVRHAYLQVPLALISTHALKATRRDTNGNPEHHLCAAQIFIHELSSIEHTPQLDQDELELLEDFYAYINAVTSLTNSESSTTTRLGLAYAPRRPNKTSGDLLGCSQDLFRLFPAICQAFQVHQDAFEYNIHRDVVHAKVAAQTLEANSEHELVAYGRLYQQAMLSYLEAIAEGKTERYPRVHRSWPAALLACRLISLYSASLATFCSWLTC